MEGIFLSVKLCLAQNTRPYKMEVYGLQDNYIGVLQSYSDIFLGQVVSPKLSIQDDGTQTLTFSIPHYYIDQETNLRVENPRWRDAENGILAENTRVIKVFIDYSGNQVVYPFIIDKITDKRDSNFQVMKEVEASGLAFAELGKTGYKLELNEQTLKNDWKTDDTILPTLNYWLDKVFPNKKDDSGNIIQWLTPWSYEIRMDWSNYIDADQRAANKMYEDIHTTSWKLSQDKTALVSDGISELQEKARLVDCAESNRYNITQDIAEAFGVFCVYEYACDNRGQFIKSDIIDLGSGKYCATTGRKAVFYNKAIKTDNPLHFTYQHNLQTVSRTLDSSELYTKLYVSPIESNTMDTGYVNIADAESNPLMDDFLLNFDYLYSIGSINDFQKKTIEEYKVSLHTINKEIADIEQVIANQTVKENDLSADQTAAKEGINNAREQYNEYQVLANNEIYTTPVHKDVNNRYTGIFTPSTEQGILICNLKLEGVLVDGYELSCYKDVKYSTTETIFSSKDLQMVSKVSTPLNNSQFYGLLDEYGFLDSIYTSISNPKLSSTGMVTYFDLYYSPVNKYQKILDKFKELEDLNTTKYDSITKQLSTLQTELKANTEKRDKLLEDKEALNYRFERLMGGALREGFWTPDSYDDVGQLVKQVAHNGDAFLWDTNPFDGETIPYYYDSAEGATSGQKIYYPYIDLSGITTPITDTFALILTKKYSTYTTTENFTGGPSKVIVDSTTYYFNLTGYKGANHKILLGITPSSIWVRADGKTIPVSTTEIANAVNLTSHFDGLNGSLNMVKLYPNAGYTLGFIKVGSTIKPIALLNNDNLDYETYKSGDIYYINETSTSIKLEKSQETFTSSISYVYPRIFLDYRNVNYQSDEFSITKAASAAEIAEGTKIENYIDYTILLREWKPYITLKVSSTNSAQDIMEKYFHCSFRVSRANEQLYLDAKQVALDNSQPKYSYDLTIANIPDEIREILLGQLVYINDYSLSIYQATGYVSGFELALDDPKEDSITIQNYKTKFEDLFSTITASSEAMKVNKRSYDIAASGFTSGGSLAPTILEKSIGAANISFNFSKTKVAIDNTGGITLTNETPYTNGVYGQVALRGGGIFCSNSLDEVGNRIWNSAITPNGINAGLITTGQLDTNLIKIYNGNNIAFQWNSEGLYAYKTLDDGTPDLSQYVKYSQNGLEYINNINGKETSTVSLGWNGLDITAQDGAVSLNGSQGLIIKNAEGKIVVALGRSNDTDPLYGLRMYQNGELNFYADNNGQLYLRQSINVGDQAGINGFANITDSSNGKTIMMWAGQTGENPESSPFIVYKDGSIKATGGKIGSLDIENIEESIKQYSIRIISSAGETFTNGVATTTILTIELYKGSDQITVPSGYTIAYQWYKKNGDNWTAITDATQGSYQVLMADKESYRCKATLTKEGDV